MNKKIVFNDQHVENLHTVEETYNIDGKTIFVKKNTCLIPSFGDGVFEVRSKEALPKGKQKVSLQVSVQDEDSLRIYATPISSAEKGGKVA